MKVTVKSRYGILRIFEDDEVDTVILTGESLCTRYGGDLHNLTYIDLEGGPFIEVGEDLEQYFDDKITRIVTEIIPDEKEKTIIKYNKQCK